ncbi:kinesin-like protein KIF13A, partial [Sinocyclocheilus anshuiensis]|uniref:kinesin-like protein KIF13A n=1 Tax=Sinocyclocheilus anshuiensis TaxID=1608454 RepID=UPI0007B85410
MVYSRVHLWHGDRVLWGNNHFFRISLPKRKRRERMKEPEHDSFVEADVETASQASSEQDYSYEFAQMEVMMKALGNNGTHLTFNTH